MEPRHLKSSVMTLSELRKEGIPGSVLSDVEALAKIRAAKATKEHGVSLDEFLEVRKTGAIGQVIAIHEDHVILDFGKKQDTFNYEAFFSPFVFATVVAGLVQEVLVYDAYCRDLAKATRANIDRILAPQKPLNLGDFSFLKLDVAEQTDGGDSRAERPSNPTS